MPRVIRVAIETPVTVQLATEVLGSELRIHLVRHYREHPGPQKDAALALGVSANAVSANTKVLIDAGVVIVEQGDDRRHQICRVDDARVRALLGGLWNFVLGSTEAAGPQ